MKKGLIFAVALIFVLGSGSALAADWPKRPIEISCFASAGGGTDTTDRAIAKAMEPFLGVKINVVNTAPKKEPNVLINKTLPPMAAVRSC